MIHDAKFQCDSDALYLYLQALMKKCNTVLPAGITHVELENAVQAHLTRTCGKELDLNLGDFQEIIKFNPDWSADAQTQNAVEIAFEKMLLYRIDHTDKIFQRIVNGILARAVNHTIVELYSAALVAIKYRYLLTYVRVGEKRRNLAALVGILKHVIPFVVSDDTDGHVGHMMRLMSTGFSTRAFIEMVKRDYRCGMSYIVEYAIKCGNISWILGAVNSHISLTSTARTMYSMFYYRQHHAGLVYRVDGIEHRYPITFNAVPVVRASFVTNLMKVCLWNDTGTLLPSLQRTIMQPIVAERLRVLSREKHNPSLSDIVCVGLSQFVDANSDLFSTGSMSLTPYNFVKKFCASDASLDEFDSVVAQSVYYMPTRVYNSKYCVRDMIGESVKSMLLECAEEVAPHIEPIMLILALHPDVQWLSSGQLRVDLTFHMFASSADQELNATMCSSEFERMVMYFMHVSVASRVSDHLVQF